MFLLINICLNSITCDYLILILENKIRILITIHVYSSINCNQDTLGLVACNIYGFSFEIPLIQISHILNTYSCFSKSSYRTLGILTLLLGLVHNSAASRYIAESGGHSAEEDLVPTLTVGGWWMSSSQRLTSQ